MQLIDIVGSVAVNCALSFGLMKAKLRWEKSKEKQNPRIDEFGAYPWLWTNEDIGEGLKCPMCDAHKSNNRRPYICEDEHYHKSHFHFECSSCKFKTIMRTVNDP